MTDAKFGRTETLIRTPDFNSISLFAMVMQFCDVCPLAKVRIELCTTERHVLYKKANIAKTHPQSKQRARDTIDKTGVQFIN